MIKKTSFDVFKGCIGLAGVKSSSAALMMTKQVFEHLQPRYDIVLEQQTARLLDMHHVAILPGIRLAEKAHLALVIGGDGSLLRAAQWFVPHHIPLIGIHQGRLGFLADLTGENLLASLDAILSGERQIEQRMLLQVKVFDRFSPTAHPVYEGFAVNEVVISSSTMAHMIDFNVSVDEHLISRLRADGFICSTATGSTAYSLSAGGPVIHPSLDTILLMAICPHQLSMRPLLVKDKSVIEIQLDTDEHAMLVLDGHQSFDFSYRCRAVIARCPNHFIFWHPLNYSFFHSLTEKLSWGKR